MTPSPQAGSSDPILRTFIAIELDRSVREALATLQSRLDHRLPHRAVRWVRPEGIHLTLKFLGNTPQSKVSQISQSLMQAAAQAPAMELLVSGLGCFPNRRRPRVVWVGLQESTGALESLWRAVEEHVSPLGWPTEARGFHPHLTLGRVNRRTSNADTRLIGQLVESTDVGQIAQVHANHVSFIRSTLKPSGAEYATIAEAKLLGRRPAAG